MTRAHFDAIVIGIGGVGSATLYHLAQRGLRVLGIDRFPPGHDRGSSHGETRVIRKAYFEHPSYVPLLNRAYEKWKELEAMSGTGLFYQTGLLEVGPAQGVLLTGVRTAASQFQLPLEELSPAEVARRFPGFRIPSGSEAVYEPEGGYLRVEDCVQAQLSLATQWGAQLAIGPSVKSWNSAGSHVEVECDTETFQAKRLVITAGAWASQLLSQLGIRFRVLRKHLHWYATQRSAYRPANNSPVFFYETPAGYYYGFPSLDEQGVKVAEHSGGELVSDPLHCDRGIDPQERLRVENFLREHLPDVAIQPTRHAVCMYTMTADEHFVVDRHPNFSNVAFAAGLSGHGFKFTCVLGEVLADLTAGHHTQYPISFLRADRPGLA